MRTLILKTEHYVSFFDYCDSLRQLLLRSSYFVNEQQQNLDILFAGVAHLQTTTSFDGLEIYEGNENDKKNIAQSENLDLHLKAGRKLYVLISKGWEYYVVAGYVKVSVNELPNSQTSIAMKKDWYNPSSR